MPANQIKLLPEEILGVPRGSTPQEISRARGKLAKMLHPDMRDGQSKAIMQLINHAVEIMMSGQQGCYTFSNGAEPREPPPRQAREEPRPNQGQQQNTCPHPKKRGYSQCFECSGVRRCGMCGEGYYRPPNDRCAGCRRRAGGGTWHGYRRHEY